MKAIRIYKNQVVKVEEVPVPEINPDEVLIKVAACGICGSDVPRVLNNAAHYYPIILGHEFSGTVEKVGANVKNITLGDHVVAAPLVPCMECDDCKSGNYSLCKHYKFIGSSLQGAMAEYVAVPKANIVKLPTTLDMRTAAMIEPLTVVLHAIKLNNYVSGKNVAVIGTGTIGCLALQAIKAFGIKNLTVVVRSNKYDDLLNRIGVDNIINTSDDNWRNIASDITSNKGYDFVFESAGSSESIKQSFELVGNKGSVCLIGTPKDEVTFSVKLWELLNRKEFNLTGSWMSYSAPFPGDEWENAVKYLENGCVKVFDEMWYKQVSLSESASIFEDYKEKGKVRGRSLIVMD